MEHFTLSKTSDVAIKKPVVVLSSGNMGSGKPKEEGDDYELGQLV
jgi:hypothetical protein